MFKFLLTRIVPVLGIVCNASADLVEFRLDNQSVAGYTSALSGSQFTGTFDDLTINGVTFDVVLAVNSSPGDFVSTSLGAGVSGGTGGDSIGETEFLSFTLMVSDVSGGTVEFVGFDSIDFNSLTVDDTAILSRDALEATSSDNFATLSDGAGDFDLSGFSPAVKDFSVIGASTAVSTAFRVDDITGNFTITPVPEASSFLAVGILCLLSKFVATVSCMLRRH